MERNYSRRRPWPMVKVCGIQSPSEGVLALACGANTIGLLVGLTHKADDEITAEVARAICDEAHHSFPMSRVVLVTHLKDFQAVTALALQIGADAIQVHDDMDPASMKRLRGALPHVELFKAIHIKHGGDQATASVIMYARRYEALVDGFFTDSKSIDPDGQLRIGGTGTRHDPLVGQALVAAFPNTPVVLAGGLNGENVSGAIREIRPAGIDANSGLENPDGSKNADKIKQFAVAGAACAQYLAQPVKR
jgi:phosphoribosylanthranilate isomerase